MEKIHLSHNNPNNLIPTPKKWKIETRDFHGKNNMEFMEGKGTSQKTQFWLVLFNASVVSNK
jgi:hypothetical protein